MDKKTLMKLIAVKGVNRISWSKPESLKYRIKGRKSISIAEIVNPTQKVKLLQVLVQDPNVGGRLLFADFEMIVRLPLFIVADDNDDIILVFDVSSYVRGDKVERYYFSELWLVQLTLDEHAAIELAIDTILKNTYKYDTNSMFAR